MRFYHVLLLPVGFVGAVLGAFIWKAPGRRAMTVWLMSLMVFFFIAGNVQRVHEYYQLPFVVMAAIFFGGAAWPLFDGAWLQAPSWRRPIAPPVVHGHRSRSLAIASIYAAA